jgi:hypothetical protein
MEVTGLIVMPFDVENTEDYRFQVLVAGEGFPVESYDLYARLGEQELQAVTVSPDGSGLCGYLVNRPENGARLFVRHPGFEEIDTGIIFPPLVA